MRLNSPPGLEVGQSVELVVVAVVRGHGIYFCKSLTFEGCCRLCPEVIKASDPFQEPVADKLSTMDALAKENPRSNSNHRSDYPESGSAAPGA